MVFFSHSRQINLSPVKPHPGHLNGMNSAAAREAKLLTGLRMFIGLVVKD
jgi:hypothetical protein